MQDSDCRGGRILSRWQSDVFKNSKITLFPAFFFLSFKFSTGKVELNIFCAKLAQDADDSGRGEGYEDSDSG